MHTAVYSFAAAALLQLASAQPADLSHGHQHVHQQRDVIVTVTQYGTAQPTHAPAPAAAAPAPAAKAGKSGASKSGSGYGIVYSPYNADHSCKSTGQVASDINAMKDYSMVRIYGVDCNQVSNVIAVAKPKNMKIFAGVYNVGSTSEEIGTLIKAVGNNWNMIDTISIGNEVINSKGAGQIPAVLAGIATARSALKSTAFKGSVVTVDTFNALIAHPELCLHSDYAAANAHAFFDPTGVAANAGTWAKKTAAEVSAACGGKKTVITESGWPSKGDCNGSACPSPESQAAAVKSLKSAFKKNLILFTAYNDLWKSDTANTHGCEKYWGILS